MCRSGTLSALGPVGGATGAKGTLCLAAAGAGGAVIVGGAAGAAGAEDVGDGEGMTAGAGLGTGAGVGTGAVTGATGSNAGGAVAEGVGVADTGVLACTGLGVAAAAVLGFTSRVGFLQTLDPKAGTAAGGDEARGAYLSLDASARLANKRSSLPGSRRESLAADGSMAIDERREYESTWGPSRSAGDA